MRRWIVWAEAFNRQGIEMTYKVTVMAKTRNAALKKGNKKIPKRRGRLKIYERKLSTQ